MADMHKTPPLALTLRGYIKHAPENWRAHMAAAADQVEENARLRAAAEGFLDHATALSDRCDSVLAAVSGWRAEMAELRALLRECRPHAYGHLAHRIDRALANEGQQ